jgi:hypothetical protein
LDLRFWKSVDNTFLCSTNFLFVCKLEESAVNGTPISVFDLFISVRDDEIHVSVLYYYTLVLYSIIILHYNIIILLYMTLNNILYNIILLYICT